MSDLSFHVRQFVPDCSGDELEQRTALLIARDYAADLLANAGCEPAFDYASAAHRTAGEYVFANVPVDRLKIAVAYCRNLVQAAFLAEHLSDEWADA